MDGKKNAWVPVLAPLLSIVIDQDSPDLVLNDFMAVGFNFHLSPELEDMCRVVVNCEQDLKEGEIQSSSAPQRRGIVKSPLQTRTLCAQLHLRGGNQEFEENSSTVLESWCREGELNPQGAKHRRILSPLRLPVPPSRPRMAFLG